MFLMLNYMIRIKIMNFLSSKAKWLAGSRGVLLSRSKNEFNDNINFIKNNYSNSEILIEEMIEGIKLALSILYTKVRFYF